MAAGAFVVDIFFIVLCLPNFSFFILAYFWYRRKCQLSQLHLAVQTLPNARLLQIQMAGDLRAVRQSP